LPIPVIYTRVECDPVMGFPVERAPYLRRPGSPICVKGTDGAEVIDELKPATDDYIVTKVRSSAFHETKLETLLRVKDVWILIVAGGSTNYGVEWLARDAKARDLVTVALRDCTYSATDEAQAASLANIDDFLGSGMNAGEVVENAQAKMSRSLYGRGATGSTGDNRLEKLHPFSSDLDKTLGILFLTVHPFPPC
jgi:ureidoacrylate peracid hydrolase